MSIVAWLIPAGVLGIEERLREAVITGPLTQVSRGSQPERQRAAFTGNRGPTGLLGSMPQTRAGFFPQQEK